MILDHLSLLNFKNIEQAEIDFSTSLNCFVGANGSGKTNILDSIHYLSLTRSASSMSDSQCLRQGEANFFIIKGSYTLPDQRSEKISVSYRRTGGKKVMRNGKQYDRLMDHIGLIPIVMIAPWDSYLISESGEERRKFLNTYLSQTDSEYMAALARYNALLCERNKLLKNPQGFDEILDILNVQMAEVSVIIHDKRFEFILRIAPVVRAYYNAISGDHETVHISYRSALNDESPIELLKRNIQRDYALGYTSSGIHRDELELSILDMPIRRYGSQGQQKSMLIAIRLAEAKIMESSSSHKAILLLDDIFDKLDMERVENLIELVSSEDFGQIFITDSNKIRLEGIVKRFATDYKLFTIDQGGITQ